MFLRILLLALLLPVFVQAQPVTAKAWLVADDTGQLIDGVNTGAVRPIASITKLLTVMVVLDSNQDLDESIKVRRYHTAASRQMLMLMALVRSDNAAADTLCQRYPTGYDGCIRALNDKAASLGMTSTVLRDPTGLNRKNVSTAEDLVKLVQAAGTYSLIAAAGNIEQVWLKTKRTEVMFRNTNPLVGQGHGILVSKTGFINQAGGCLVMQMLTINGLRTIILLGSKNTLTRAPEALMLASLK